MEKQLKLTGTYKYFTIQFNNEGENSWSGNCQTGNDGRIHLQLSSL
jgi:hypothetical protein